MNITGGAEPLPQLPDPPRGLGKHWASETGPIPQPISQDRGGGLCQPITSPRNQPQR